MSSKSEIHLTSRVAAYMICACLICCFAFFVAGYFLGRYSYMQNNVEELENYSLRDKVSYSLCIEEDEIQEEEK